VLKGALRPLRRALTRVLAVPDPEHIYIRALREQLFYKVGALIAYIQGDYLEFGVYTGNSFGLAYQAIRQAFIDTSTPDIWNSEPQCAVRRELWASMRFVAFDSFQGLPEPTGGDTYTGLFTKGALGSSESEFRRNVRDAGVPESKIVTVPGFFDCRPSPICTAGARTIESRTRTNLCANGSGSCNDSRVCCTRRASVPCSVRSTTSFGRAATRSPPPTIAP
jgi:hypothetical protein